MVGFLFGWQQGTAVEPNVSHVLEGLHLVLRSYQLYLAKLDRLKQVIENLVKPDSVTQFAYIDIIYQYE